jgi:hypothetical protein
MNISAKISKHLLKRKLATVVLVAASMAAFASLGDGGGKKAGQKKSLSSKFAFTAKDFSLRSDLNYKGNNILNADKSTRFIMMNSTVTYQKGNATYILPLKKKVILDKVNFNPAAGK